MVLVSANLELRITGVEYHAMNTLPMREASTVHHEAAFRPEVTASSRNDRALCNLCSTASTMTSRFAFVT